MGAVRLILLDGRMTRDEWLACGGDGEEFDRYVDKDGRIEVDEKGCIKSVVNAEGYRLLPTKICEGLLLFKECEDSWVSLQMASSLPGFAGYAYRVPGQGIMVDMRPALPTTSNIMTFTIDVLLKETILRPFAVVVKEDV